MAARKVVAVDEDRCQVVVLVGNVEITFQGDWVGDRLELRVVSKSKPGAMRHDPAALDVPEAVFAAAAGQAAQILTERRERRSRVPEQLTLAFEEQV